MSTLAIKGHKTRGKEVIEILKMLGGENIYNKSCSNDSMFCYISDENCICELPISESYRDFILFTLEEFLDKFPYKVEDKVTTDDGDEANIVGMVWDNDIDDVFYETQICNEVFKYPKELLQPYKEETMEEKENSITFNIEHKQLKVNSLRFDKTQLVINDEYELKQEGDTYYIVHKQPKYPKTYEECCKLLSLGEDGRLYTKGYKASLIQNFQKLIICRDAYWKIAGDWEPNLCENFIYAIGTCYGTVEKRMVTGGSGILLFHTEEMRDAFYENFKELIESCKELL